MWELRTIFIIMIFDKKTKTVPLFHSHPVVSVQLGFPGAVSSVTMTLQEQRRAQLPSSKVCDKEICKIAK